jgi:hypothetical protein
LVKNYKTTEELNTYFLNKKINYDLKLIKSLSSNKLLQFFFNKTYNDLVTCFKKGFKFNKKQSFGSQIVIDGYSFRSLGEHDIYQFLKKNGVEFLYEKTYPNSVNGKKRLKSDFYLPKFDLYIEYCGMYNVKNITKHSKIIVEYDKRIHQKKNHCYSNDLKCIFSSDVNSIKKIILDMII